ncbi:GNAT family N-acetyltransferase [Oceanobacter mangrovi]|uniref:GNAT family N-acetyltransferase n=1 Tax=Oceanobacter mangrovi TaxID=2862510 RepID=UPI001C8DAF25|nr:GNAT family N-acetyltransferase [Oceanobacter mangrovi]
MVQIDSRKLIFSRRSYWFTPPQDVSGCDVVSFFACQSDVTPAGFSRTESRTLLINLQQDESTLLQNMSKNCRYEINRASREGLTTQKNVNQQAFFDLYQDFVKAKQFSGDLDMYWHFVEQGTLYTCYWEGELIGGLLALQDEQHSRWILSGSKRLTTDDKTLSKVIGYGNRLLIWEAIKDAKAKGLEFFDLGGFYDGCDESNPEYRIARFKSEFGGAAVSQYKFSKTYSPLLKLAKQLKKSL